MNCQAVQNQIIALSDPRQLSPVLLAHVAGCSACRAWARKAAQLESLLEQLPVPPAPREKKEALIGELLAADPVIQPPVVPATRPSFVTVAVRVLRQNRAYVGGIAAAVLVVVGLVWSLNRTKPPQTEFAEPQKHPLLDKLVNRDVALARAETPTKRLEVLGGMAEDLAGETRGMARIASPTELKDLARLYDKVVKDGIVRQAKELPIHMDRGEKQRLLDGLKTRLEADAAEADKVAREAPQDSQPALKRVADTAREGARELARTEGK
ncbi:MAG TPA: hypothetical protein VGE74_30705 [Gemmata sp.]